MRSERPGRDGPGSVLRGGTSVNRGRSSFNDRDEGRPMVMNEQVSSHTKSDFSYYVQIFLYKSGY